MYVPVETKYQQVRNSVPCVANLYVLADPMM